MYSPPLYEVGDWVRVKDLDTLKRDLGDPIKAQCGWVPDPMDRFAGGRYKIYSCKTSMLHGFHYSYQTESTGIWWFSEDTLEPLAEACVNINMSFDDLLEGL